MAKKHRDKQSIKAGRISCNMCGGTGYCMQEKCVACSGTGVAAYVGPIDEEVEGLGW